VKFYVEKYNTSDNQYTVISVLVGVGSWISKDQLIFEIDSSKAAIDVEAPTEGYLYYSCKSGDKIAVGDLFFILSTENIKNFATEFIPATVAITAGFTISKKAMSLLELNGIDYRKLNKTIIKEKDVIEFLEKREPSNGIDELLLSLTDQEIKKATIILGGKGGAKMCIEALKYNNEYKIIGILDDNLEINTKVYDINVLGGFALANTLIKMKVLNFVLAFGVLENRNVRFRLYKQLKEDGALFPNVIHPKSIVEDSVNMGEGNVILAGSNVGSDVILGNLNYINNSAVISHDCILNNNVHIAPGAVLGSSIKIGDSSLIGMNCTLFYGIKIGANSVINNGLIINNDVSDNTVIKK